MIDAECDKLCSRDVASAFRNSTAEDLKKFKFDTLASDLQRTAPTVWSILCTIATPTGKYSRRPDWHHPLECVVLAAAIVLRECNVHMSAAAYVIGLILWQGNASTKVGDYPYLCIIHIHALHTNTCIQT